MRRAALTLVLLASCALLGACGKSAYVGASAGAQRGARPGAPARAAATVRTVAQAKRMAARLNLRASDLPGFKARSKREHESNAEKSQERELVSCIGGQRAGGALAEAGSKGFERTVRVFSVSVGSNVTVMRTPAQAAADVTAIRSAHTRTCLTRYVVALLAKQTHGASAAKLDSVIERTPPAAGASGAFAWRITGSFALRKVKIPFYIELVGFAYGQAEVEMLSFGLPLPFPAVAEQQLFSLLLERAKAGGAGAPGRAGRAPRTPAPSAPRQVPIALWRSARP